MKPEYRQRYLAKPKGQAAYKRAQATWQRKRNGYAISEQDCLAILTRQEGKCGICPKELKWPDRNSHVDHDHKTGLIRGILCNRCNRGIGAFDDDPVLLASASAYVALSVAKSG